MAPASRRSVRTGIRRPVSLQLGVGFGLAVLAIGIGSTLAFGRMHEVGGKLVALVDGPAGDAVTCVELEREVERSLATLRGYVLFGDDAAAAERLAAERAESWRQIRDRLASLQTSRDEPDALAADLEELARLQTRVEDIAHTPRNRPGLVALEDEVEPRASALLADLRKMLDEEQGPETRPLLERRLAELAAAEAHLASTIASLRAYLVSGDAFFETRFDGEAAAFAESLDRLAKHDPWTADQQRALSATLEQRTPLIDAARHLLDARNGADSNLAAHWIGTKAAPLAQSIRAQLREFRAGLAQQLDRDIAAARADRQQMNVLFVAALAGGALLAAGVAMLMSRRFARNVRALVARAEAIAGGDLRAAPPACTSNDELGDLAISVESTSDALRRVLTAVADATRNVTEVGASVQRGAVSVTEGTQNQAAAIEQITASLEQLTAMARQNSESASHANELSASVVESARGGEVTLHEFEEQIAELKSAHDETNSVIRTIEDIAFQTNLLALNAAVEAARAGEAGAGFAVVAQEVRRLAHHSANAAKSTATLIQRAVHSAEQGDRMTASTLGAFTDILQRASELDRVVSSITRASDEQRHGAEQINLSMQGVQIVTDTTVQATEDSAAAAVAVDAEAKRLQDLVASFRL